MSVVRYEDIMSSMHALVWRRQAREGCCGQKHQMKNKVIILLVRRKGAPAHNNFSASCLGWPLFGLP